MSTIEIRQAAEQQSPTSHANVGPSVHELDARTSEGIEVRLLWNSRTDRVWIVVNDHRRDEMLMFQVRAADALHAFRHPYAYASTQRVTSLHP